MKRLETKLPIKASQALEKLMGERGVTYNVEKNIFVTNGYESAAGNIYYKGVRASNKLVIVYDFGQGWKYLFLNRIEIYGFNGKDKVLLSTKDFYCNVFTENQAREEAIRMIEEMLKSQIMSMNGSYSDSDIHSASFQLVSEAIENKCIKEIA